MKEIKITSIATMSVAVNGGNTEVSIHGDDSVQVSDGYHTFEELYDHRVTLFIALCRLLRRQENAIGAIQKGDSFVWRSKTHHDGSTFDGWFIMGLGKFQGEQITYHLPLDRWEETDFAETLDSAPEWDEHTSQMVLARLKGI